MGTAGSWEHDVDIRESDEVTVDGVRRSVKFSDNWIQIGCTRISASALERVYKGWKHYKDSPVIPYLRNIE